MQKRVSGKYESVLIKTNSQKLSIIIPPVENGMRQQYTAPHLYTTLRFIKPYELHIECAGCKQLQTGEVQRTV